MAQRPCHCPQKALRSTLSTCTQDRKQVAERGLALLSTGRPSLDPQTLPEGLRYQAWPTGKQSCSYLSFVPSLEVGVRHEIHKPQGDQCKYRATGQVLGAQRTEGHILPGRAGELRWGRELWAQLKVCVDIFQIWMGKRAFATERPTRERPGAVCQRDLRTILWFLKLTKHFPALEPLCWLVPGVPLPGTFPPNHLFSSKSLLTRSYQISPNGNLCPPPSFHCPIPVWIFHSCCINLRSQMNPWVFVIFIASAG